MKKLLLIVLCLLPSLVAFSQISQREHDFLYWCDDLARQLRQARHEAAQLYAYGDYQSALGVLQDALESSHSEEMLKYNKSLTLRALNRGLEITQSLLDNLNSDSGQARRVSYFLSQYLGFVVRVAQRLDIPHYSYRHHYRAHHNMRRIEQTYVDMAFGQLQLIMDHFALRRGNMVYPVGGTDLFLHLMAISSGHVAWDLEESFFAEFYSCKIRRLHDLQRAISRYLEGGGRDPRFMVQKAYWDAREVVRESGWRCGRRYPDYGTHYDDYHPSSTRDILGRSFTLRDGQAKIVSLRRPQHIRKLIISARGVNRDASFDVVVNGDIKGSIYVPGRDPAYYVTVEDWAQSIEFVGRRGKAKIENILLVP